MVIHRSRRSIRPYHSRENSSKVAPVVAGTDPEDPSQPGEQAVVGPFVDRRRVGSDLHQVGVGDFVEGERCGAGDLGQLRPASRPNRLGFGGVAHVVVDPEELHMGHPPVEIETVIVEAGDRDSMGPCSSLPG